jgi:hypothetical protein
MRRAALFVFLTWCSAALSACEDSDDLGLPPPESDDIPPATITDLALASRDSSAVVLRWTAPGDDGSVGVAWRYDLRHSESPITPESWSSSSQVGGEPTPGFPGWQQVFEVIHLQEGRTYYFAIRTFDDHSNVSPISNVLEVVPGSGRDTDPPSAISDLAAETGGKGSVRLTWTAPGNDGVEGTAWGYEIRYSPTPLDPSNFRTGRAVLQSPIPHPSGTRESFEITELEAGTVYYFGIRAWDEASNASPVSNFVSAMAGE